MLAPSWAHSSSSITISRRNRTHHLLARAAQGCCGYFPLPRRRRTTNPLPCCSQTFRELSRSSRRCSLPRAGCSGQHSSHPCLFGKRQEQLDPNLGDTSSQQRSLDPSMAQPCRQPGASFAPCVSVCFLRRFFCEFPLPGCCVTSGSLCRSLSKCWSTAQLFLI